MASPQMNQPKLLSTRFLQILLIISILTNIILVIKLKSPSLWTRFQYAFTPAPIVQPTDHIRGNANAKYTIIEYSDFQCPYCAKVHEAFKKLTHEADVRWVYRHFPLERHQLAVPAAEAAECAGDQGKFWEYAGALFAHQKDLSEQTFPRIARDLNLNMISFQLCITTGAKRGAVLAQLEEGRKKKIGGTPTFYLNGKRFDGFVPEEELRKLAGK